MSKLSEQLKNELEILAAYEAAIDMDPEQEAEAINALTAANTQSIEQIGRSLIFKEFLESQAERMKAEVERVTAIKKRLERIQESIKWHILNYMQITGQDVIEVGTHKISIGESESTIIQDESLLPAELAPRVVIIKPDKTAIKKAIKSGLAVPGAYIEKTKFLRVK